ncbi:MAG: UDP-N-acetylmuramate dehydrogenase [Atribacterota bacterium]|nr:UDP-N-acetylmuramate dehydrogenase [Atribacterota bacterium]
MEGWCDTLWKKWERVEEKFRQVKGLHVVSCPKMEHFTTFKIGGQALALLDVQNDEHLEEVIILCEENQIPWRVLGRGSNILVSDLGFEGVVLRLRGDFADLRRLDESRVEAGAGALLKKAVEFCIQHGLGGCEFLFGVPGTVGGAVLVNAGCFGGEIGNLVERVLWRNEKGQREWKSRDELCFSYRSSSLKQKNTVILKVVLKLLPRATDRSWEMIGTFSALRKNAQPLEWPSAGSIFRNPPGYYAARLIEEMGFKGLRLGQAQVSPKHANFIVNLGGATASQVEGLMEWIRREIYREKGILLENEVEVWR